MSSYTSIENSVYSTEGVQLISNPYSVQDSSLEGEKVVKTDVQYSSHH